MKKQQMSKITTAQRNQSRAALVVKTDGFMLPAGFVTGFMKT